MRIPREPHKMVFKSYGGAVETRYRNACRFHTHGEDIVHAVLKEVGTCTREVGGSSPLGRANETKTVPTHCFCLHERAGDIFCHQAKWSRRGRGNLPSDGEEIIRDHTKQTSTAWCFFVHWRGGAYPIQISSTLYCADVWSHWL